MANLHCRVLIPILVLVSACAAQTYKITQNQAQSIVSLVSPDGLELSIHVEIADEPEERSRGLMDREHLSEGTGMLFIFDTPSPLHFWMKNTLIPLDILFLAGDGSFVSALTMAPCMADPCPSYFSSGDAQYALEVPAGYMQRHEIGEGWRLKPPNQSFK